MRLFEFIENIGWRVLVQTRDISNGAITTRLIADGSITGEKIADGSITGEKIADGSIGGEKIADGALDASKMRGEFSGEKIQENSIPVGKIVGEIPSDRIADGSITGEKIAEGSIDGSKMAEGSIEGSRIAEGAITNEKLAEGTVDALRMNVYPEIVRMSEDIDAKQDAIEAGCREKKAEVDAAIAEVDQRIAQNRAEINAKQLEIGAVQTDEVPTEGSVNMVNSGAVYNALVAEDRKIADIDKVLSTEVTDYTVANYSILETGKFGTSTSYTHGVCKVAVGEIYLLENINGVCWYAFVTSNSVESGGDIPLLEGTDVGTIAGGSHAVLSIPDGCTHLLFSAGSKYNVKLWKYKDALDNIKSDAALLNTVRLVGNDNTSVEKRMKGLLAGHSYRMYVKNTEIDMSTVTSSTSYYRLYVQFKQNAEATAENPVAVNMGTELQESYEFTLPEGDANFSVVIGMRASSGAEQVFVVVDVTATQSLAEQDFFANMEGIAGVGLIEKFLLECALYEKEVIDLSAVSSRTYSISGTNYGTNSSLMHKVLEVSAGDFVKVKANDDSSTVIRFLTGCQRATSGAVIPVVEGSPAVSIKKGSSRLLKVPEGSRVLAVYTGASFANAPDEITVYRLKTKTEHYAGREVVPIDCTGYRAQGSTVSSGSVKCLLIPLEYGIKYRLDVNPGLNTTNYLAYLDRLPEVNLEVDYFTLTGNSSDRVYFAGSTEHKYLMYYTGSSKLSISCHETSDVIAGEDSEVMRSLDDVRNILSKLNYEEVALSSFANRNYSINGETGLYGTSSTYKHVVVPVEPGEYIKIKAGEENIAIFAFLTDNDAPISNGMPHYAAYETRKTIARGATAILRVPDDAHYMFVYKGASPYTYMPEYVGISDFSRASDDKSDIPVIVSANGEERTRSILNQITKGSRYSQDNPPLCLVHFSDLHGNNYNMARINEWRAYWKDFINDTLFTGDLATTTWSFSDSFWSDEACGDILNCLGNHDTLVGDDWHDKQGLEAYNRYFAPFIENWGVIQPENAAENGYCFYYKDYSVQKIRLIVTDPFNNDAEYRSVQKQWFRDVLSDALSNEMNVVVANHYGIKSERLIDCNLTKINSPITPDTSSVNDDYIGYVSDYIAEGGKFICWLCGHSHYNRIAVTSEATGNQVSICVADAARSQYDHSNDNSHMAIVNDDLRTRDAFFFTAIDTYFKRITLFWIGAEWDKWGRHLGTCCIDYANGKLLGQA